jgi:hypothetical protein
VTLFLDARLSAVGGGLAASVAASLPLPQLLNAVRGRHVLIAMHGFHVDRAAGTACLSNWESLLELDAPAVFIGLLWPGDSIWLHGLDYPEEPRVADEAGGMLGAFLDANFHGAASVSFVSHSLGARVLLATIENMTLPVRRAVIMAGAIDDDCLNVEFRNAAAKVGRISVLASSRDPVLADAFPLGNFVAGIIDQGHPWWKAALGRNGPSRHWLGNFQAPFEIPRNWDFGHGDYLKMDGAPTPRIAIPMDVPVNGSAEPDSHGWQEAWTAAFVSTRFR